ncbi:radical SAM protein [Aquitalea palustris]|uniref:S-adenosylmethionine-dependent nucleotide dehydratase n=1 Tax=Aquitalea palustris TaxID=2480983 RepID=A0A454JL59_9NEIS|nr:viperin family antiviral radical SAM protein [Aquitalea palustris]RMD00157.1 radical SAM protein [Aquitalea palustris]
MKRSLVGKGLVRPQLSELVINWHITEACNYSCRYCYAHWDGSGRELAHDIPASTQMLQNLWQYFHPQNLANPLRRAMSWQGVRLNLAGGEPLLYPAQVEHILSAANEVGFTTSLITNASLLSPELAQRLAPKLSMLGISLDSCTPMTNSQIGRQGRHGQQLGIGHLEEAVCGLRRWNPKLQIKLNTVVNALNCHEDLNTVIGRISPQRWKVLRMLPVVTNALMVSDSDFQGFVARHQPQAEIMCVEDNTEMVESYIMIDPLGRFFQNASDQSIYSYSHPILKVGVEQAFLAVGMNPAKFCARYQVLAEEEVA